MDKDDLVLSSLKKKQKKILQLKFETERFFQDLLKCENFVWNYIMCRFYACWIWNRAKNLDDKIDELLNWTRHLICLTNLHVLCCVIEENSHTSISFTKKKLTINVGLIYADKNLK